MYRRSLTFLCGMACNNLFPHRHFTIGHSLGHAYYFQLEDKDETPLTEDDIKKLDEEMRSLVSQSIPINPKSVSWYDAVHYLETAGIPEALLMVKTKNTPLVPIVECAGFFHPAQGPYLDNTSKLTHFEVMKYGAPNGFLIRFPPSSTPFALDKFEDQPKLFETFQNTRTLEQTMGCVCVGEVNSIVRSHNQRNLKDFILFCEAIHDRTLVRAATDATKSSSTRIILIAGPSSSGKTTFARKLCVHLRVLGKAPICLSLDDFYLNRTDMPWDEETQDYDFEALEALDLKLINETFLALLEGKEVKMPRYNFKTGKREWSGATLKMKEETILVVEGIHGLNDKLTPMIPKEAKFKIFISALTRINIDEHHRVSTTDNRIIRRMVRDFQFRGTSAAETIQRWPSVRAGEVKHIFPFQNTADLIFNSAVEYELNALKTIAEPLLKSILPSQTDVYPEAQRLLRFLSNFDTLDSDVIPSTALVREFIGGSLFHDE